MHMHAQMIIYSHMHVCVFLICVYMGEVCDST